MEEQRTATDQQRKYVCAKCGGKGILLTPEGEGLLQFLLRHTNVETV